MRSLLLGIFAVAAFWPSVLSADLLLYPLPRGRLVFVLQGEVTVNPGGTLTFRHPNMGNLYFRVNDVRWFDIPTTTAIASRQIQKASTAQDAEACLAAAHWALHQGLLRKSYEAASAAWKISPDHPTVKRLAALKRKMDAPVPVSAEQEAKMRKFVPMANKMQFVRSKHFLLLHDTPPTPQGKSRKTRAEQRLELLETVYESFLLKFCLAGVELEVPKEHLMTVLFAEKEDYLEFSTGLRPELAKASGYYTKKDNISVFFDQGTNEVFEILDQLNGKLQEMKKQAVKERRPGTADLVRLVDTLNLITMVARENSDIEVVSHEATHHMAAATGLMPNDAQVPVWAAEGLATYFESPKEAAWSGIGAVNEERLEWYRNLAKDRTVSNIDFIVSDRIFMNAATDEGILHGYGQSWALTHFLMERYPTQLIEYYRVVGQRRPGSEEPGMPPKLAEPKENIEAFDRVFGLHKAKMEREWRRYMDELKTDIEMVLGFK